MPAQRSGVDSWLPQILARPIPSCGGLGLWPGTLQGASCSETPLVSAAEGDGHRTCPSLWWGLPGCCEVLCQQSEEKDPTRQVRL